jgi:hypothetical protein
MNMTIDRIEEGIAVLIGRDEAAMRMTIPVSGLPLGCREGDVVRILLEKDDGETRAARDRVAGLVEKLKKKE